MQETAGDKDQVGVSGTHSVLISEQLLIRWEWGMLSTQICYFEKDIYSYHTVSTNNCPQAFSVFYS